ncbi:hypothetical protein M404DRAFT_598654 [Pisolithus tinctorius Marx 270]|uniref:Uncharacterized protein n=1 Tax=Pisolithus tinctorius Marx 270 TaxID=870435 RepID=A0A0C3P8H8_PISTI|nr:hypothetical protein M404DRAFT_598654 [Pisolithus tinctorius Marx 270]
MVYVRTAIKNVKTTSQTLEIRPSIINQQESKGTQSIPLVCWGREGELRNGRGRSEKWRCKQIDRKPPRCYDRGRLTTSLHGDNNLCCARAPVTSQHTGSYPSNRHTDGQTSEYTF